MLRRGFAALKAVQDGIGTAFGSPMPAEYFHAIYNDADEADARFNIYHAHYEMSRQSHAESPG